VKKDKQKKFDSVVRSIHLKLYNDCTHIERDNTLRYIL
jgi:hypothetical protein